MPNELRNFVTRHHLKRFKKGEIIITQSTKPDFVYFVKGGVVQSFKNLPDGEKQLVGFNIVNDFFPLSWIFYATPSSPYSYEAITDCELYAVSRKNYNDFLLKHPAQMQKTLTYFGKRYSLYQKHIIALSQPKAIDKVMMILSLLSQQFGTSPVSKNYILINLPLTQQILSGLTGLSRETVAKELAKLKKRGIVNYQRRRYLLKVSRLHELQSAKKLPDSSIVQLLN